MTAPASQGRLLARNTVLNFIGQVLPGLTALVLVPYTVHGLGVARFGVLSLAWILIGYLSLFDLGLGRATIRFVADAVGREEGHQIPRVVWTSAAIQFTSGVVGGLAVAALANVLVPGVIKVPADLVPEARTVIVLLGLGLPILVVTTGFKGVLEAHQRFDLVNIVRSTGGVLMFGIPAAGVFLHLSLPAIMLALLCALGLVALAYVALDLVVAPSLRSSIRVDRHLVKPLFVFGGWVSVSSLVVPILVYADRLLVSALNSVSVLAYYTVPYELVSRLQVVPWSLGTALFPALSSSAANAAGAEVRSLYGRSVKYLFVAMSPLALFVLAGANPILAAWLGPSFASRGTVVMQLLAIGMLLNALSQIPAHLLDAIGRPDLRAKTFLSYMPVYVALAWYLIANHGVNGAALAWSLRGALELCLFFGVVWRVRGIGPDLFLQNRTLLGLATFGVFAGAGYGLGLVLSDDRLQLAAATLVLVLAYGAMLWRLMLDQAERSNLLSIIWNLFGAHGKPTRTHSESAV